MSEQQDAIVVTGRAMIENMRLITLRVALGTEIRTGMKRSNSGRSTLALVNEAMGTSFKRKRDAYDEFDLRLTEAGASPRPLPEETTCDLCGRPFPGETYQAHREHCAGDVPERRT